MSGSFNQYSEAIVSSSMLKGIHARPSKNINSEEHILLTVAQHE